MKKGMRKSIVGFLLSLLIVMEMMVCDVPIFIMEAEAATFNDINASNVFLKQGYNSTDCTLVASAMMVRRAAMMNGNSNWNSITGASMESTAWIEGVGLKNSFSYAGINVNCGTLSDNKTQTMINLLNSHPEGIVIYRFNPAHAILLTDYTNGTFYCADPSPYYSSGRISLSAASINSIEVCNKYWYVSSPKVSLSSGPSSVNLSVGTGDVVDITETNAVLRGMVYNTSQVKSGLRCGVRIGTFSGNYNVKTYLEDASQAAYNSGSEFPMWFNCNSELGITLKRGTTYYYQMIITYGGKTYYGTEKTFKTPGSNNPVGAVDTIESTEQGKVHVVGWAFDQDSLSTALDIHVYIGGPAGSGATCYAIGKANKYRPDLEKGYQCGSYHGFNNTIITTKSGKQPIYIYALNVGGGNNNPLIGSGTINIVADTTKPTVTTAEISENVNGKFTVKGTATDNIAVASLIFEIQASNAMVKTKTVSASSQASVTFSASELSGVYTNGKVLTVNVYAVDKAGNKSAKKSISVTVKNDSTSSNKDDKDNVDSGNFKPGNPVSTPASGDYTEQNDGRILETQAQTRVKKLLPSHKSMKVALKKVKSVTGYQIQYSTNKKFKKAVKTKTINKNSKVKLNIKKLKSGKKYYIRVRTYKITKQNGKSIKTYSKWSKVKSVKIK